MTITLSTDLDSLVLTSSFISAWVGEDPTHTFSLTLLIAKSCTTTPTEIVLDDTTIDLDNINITIVPEDIGQETTFEDGVYSIVIRKVVTSTGSSSEDVGCKFIDATTGCDVIDYIADNMDSNLMPYYTALLNTDNCSQCICANACIIYNYIANKLSKTTSTNATNSDCGCD